MKRLILLLIICSVHLLAAQIQVLPDLEIEGESNVKIFLYKKALPYSFASTLADGLATFLPMQLPSAPQSGVSISTPPLRHYLHLEGSSRFEADAHYRYHPEYQFIDALGLSASYQAPKSHLLSRHATLRGDWSLPHELNLRTQLLLYKEEARAMQSEYLGGQMILQARDLHIAGLSFSQFNNELRLHQLEQQNLGLDYQSKGLGWYHHSTLKIKDLHWGNAIHLNSGKAAVHSQLTLPIELFDTSSIHLIYDGYHLMPSFGFHYEQVSGYGQLFTVSNAPQSMPNHYAEALDQYRWVAFGKFRQTNGIPLNLQFKYELLQPWEAEFQFTGMEFSNRSRYYSYLPMLQDGLCRDLPHNLYRDAPLLYYADVFENSTVMEAHFGEAPFSLKQGLEFTLAYLPKRDWRPQTYKPLLSVSTCASFDQAPYHAALGLDQHYFSEDERQKALPELFDLSLQAAYDIAAHSKLYVRVQNLLNSPIRAHSALPKAGASVYLGMSHRF